MDRASPSLTPKSKTITPDGETGKRSKLSQMDVLVRIRPMNKSELQAGTGKPCLQANNDKKTLQVFNPDGKISVMQFNRICNEQCNQETFFDDSGVKDLLSQSMMGYVTTIFAFGQTSAGKTYTITGPMTGAPNPETVGIVPRALEYIFKLAKQHRESESISKIRIQASYLEIYNENVLDLLNPQNSGLPVRWSAERGFFVENLFIVDCDTLDDCLAVLEEGLRNRTTAGHEMNEHSSRSHSVLTIYLEINGKGEEKELQHRYGKVSFVDLAGSEKVKESKTTLDTFAEALSINKSLLTLGKCITALADPKTRGGHIPFRDSKLTRLLADSLSGKGQALMIACISPAMQNLHETLKTVRYAMQARKIQSRPVIQLDPLDEMVLNFKQEIQMLRKENTKLKELLRKDAAFSEGLKLIEAETGEIQKALKSRPASPVSQKTPSNLKLKQRADTRTPQQGSRSRDSRTPVPNHARRNTTSQMQYGTGGRKKILNNALPNRVTDGRKVTKSAAGQRVEGMRRSVAPASHEEREGPPIKSSSPVKGIPKYKKLNIRTRPSATEVPPSLESKEAFPLKPVLLRPVPLKVVTQAVPLKVATQVVPPKPENERRRTLKEVQALDREIRRMKAKI